MIEIMKDYVKFRSKRTYVVIGIYVALLLFTANDAWLYHVPIAKITHVETQVSGQVQDTRGGQETEYTQRIQGKLLNGSRRGQLLTFTNQYTKTEMTDIKYHKGDRIFVDGSLEYPGTEIRGKKRDTLLVALLGVLILLLLRISGKYGYLTIMSVVFNSLVFLFGIWYGGDIEKIFQICCILSLVFVVLTMFILNGIGRRTWEALVATLLVLLFAMLLFIGVMNHTPELDYTTMEYFDLQSIDNPEEIFKAEILLSGLGAIMDVAVAISTSLEEIAEKKQDVGIKALVLSGREIGYDIMGTMINVVMFVFLCSLMPACLIYMNNGVSLLTIMKLYVPCEIGRFLVESIAIVWSIPVSIGVTILFILVSKKIRGGR